MKDAAAFYDLEDGTTSFVTSLRFHIPRLADLTSRSGKPQYALLNAAFLEFEAGGWGAAREVRLLPFPCSRSGSDDSLPDRH